MKQVVCLLLIIMMTVLTVGCETQEKETQQTEQKTEQQIKEQETDTERDEQKVEVTLENFEQYFTIQTEIMSSNESYEEVKSSPSGRVYTHKRSVKFLVFPKQGNMKIENVSVIIAYQDSRWSAEGADSQELNLSYKGEGIVTFFLSYKSPTSSAPVVKPKVIAASGSIVLS